MFSEVTTSEVTSEVTTSEVTTSEVTARRSYRLGVLVKCSDWSLVGQLT